MQLGAELLSPVVHHTKTCSKCGVVKLTSEFAKHETGKYGVSKTCKPCKNVYKRQWYAENKERCAIVNAKWSSDNLHKKREYRAKRRANILQATPAWANNQAIKRIYKEADFLCKATGIKYEVDHIIPLQGKNVCGLHVASNLQVIKMIDNRQKAVRYED
jgi:hypothetical protein